MTKEMKWIFLCAAVATGEGLGFACGRFAFLWPAAAGLAGLVAAALYGHGCRRGLLLVAVLTGFALALAATDRRQRTLDDLLEVNAGTPLTAEFTLGDDLREEVTKDGRRGFTFTGIVRDIPVRVHLRHVPGQPAPAAGEVWSVTGWLGRMREGPFGRRLPLWVGGRGTEARRVAAESGGVDGFLRRLRVSLSRRIGLGLDHAQRTADLNRAMLLGERHRIRQEDRDSFVAAGTIHIFAISGLHVLFVAHLLEFLLRLLRLPRRGACLVLLPLVWLYVVVVGCGPSAVRAATMATFYYSATLFWRRPNGFTAWALAFLVTYIRDPAMWFNAGCAFSFTVMFALVLWQWWCDPFPAQWVRKLGFAAIAWLAGVPLAAHLFGRITPGGLLANLAVVPLAAISVVTTALGVLASCFSDAIAGHFNNFAALSTNLMAALSRFVGGTDWSTCTVEPWGYGKCLLWYAAALLILLFLRAVLLQRGRTL